MKRSLIVLMSFFIFFSFLNITTYANTPEDKPKPIIVKLNGETLEFDTEPIIVNDRTMVPMRAIFEQLGAQVKWHGETKTVTGYRRYKDISDVFIKLKIGDDVAYRNGKSSFLDSPAIIRDDRTLVPVRFIAESFGIDVDWDGENRAVLLTYDSADVNGPKLIDDTSYIPKFSEHGLNLMIPEYWDGSDDSNKFGYKDEETNIQMVLNIIEFEESKTLEEFTEESKTSILDEYIDKIVFTDSNAININNIDVNVVYLKNSSFTPEINQVIYYFTSSNFGYKITFSYFSESNDSQLLNIISNIVSTLEISGVTFDTKKEHYIEYDAFFDYGINLSSKIESSMEVKDEFDFKGIINNNSDLEYFVANISKGDEKCTFKIPILDYQFDSKLYTPFKLGKHDITLEIPESQDKIMQFSVINTSGQDIRYLIPSIFVEKDDIDIINLANEITKDINNHLPDYDKAMAIFEWISENIEYDLDEISDIPRSAKKVLIDKKGINEEISYLYTALLRASGIPSRLVKGEFEEDYHVWNEVYINGQWNIVDVTWGSGYIDSENMTKKLDMSYFNPKREDFESKFSETVILEY